MGPTRVDAIWKAAGVQDAPSAAQLLHAIATTLERDVQDQVSGGARHTVRVAVNLCRILAREHELDVRADADAVDALAALVARAPRPASAGDDESGAVTPGAVTPGGGPPADPSERTVARLWRQLAAEIDTLDDGAAADEYARDAHGAVMMVVRAKLAVAKPGYASTGSNPL